jgi:hypothetical protein
MRDGPRDCFRADKAESRRDSGIPDDGRFVGKPYDAAELFTEVDDLMRKS